MTDDYQPGSEPDHPAPPEPQLRLRVRWGRVIVVLALLIAALCALVTLWACVPGSSYGAGAVTASEANLGRLVGGLLSTP